MTREEFLDEVTTWGALLSFCDEYGCGICEDIIDDDYRDDEIDNDIVEAIRDDRWYELKEYLNNIPTGYDYYLRNGMFSYEGMDDSDFDGYRNDVLEWADNEGVWDEDEEDYDVFAEQAVEDEEPEPVPEEEDFTVGDLIGMCCVAFATIQQADAQRMKEEEQRLQQLYPKVLR